MKVRFNIVTNFNAHWIRVHRSKYRVRSGLPESLSRGCCSFLWRSLTKGTSIGSFPLKSEYGTLREGSWNLEEPIWQLPWKFKGPQQVRFFLWLALKQRLLTNAKTARRGVGIDGICQVCGHGSEDIMHELRDCPASRDIWNKLIPVDKVSKFYSSWVKRYTSSSKSSLCGTRGLVDNYRLESNWVRLSTDGLVRMDDSFDTARGYVCDRNVGWIFGFSRYLGMCSTFDAELWGILDGLYLIQERGYENVLIQTDSLEAINAI
ncbi:hypothetical protein PVK06_012017 [Gossypium arboreum]|uniref:Uncharacterized protein n=1 Tax=Gossypium arboreum TaxID=29729 RepID=A0ABR0QBJ2_GOSAR|nr:hypothetical protein PVK06_012017 [Gossypium arboreum]